MNLKKLLILFLILAFISPSFCFADDLLSDDELDNFIEVSNDTKDSIKEPITNARHIIAIDRKSLTPFYEKNAYTEVPMASTTKIMTAMIVLEKCDLSETIEFSEEAANVQGSCLEVLAGAKISLNDALYGLMLRSRK